MTRVEREIWQTAVPTLHKTCGSSHFTPRSWNMFGWKLKRLNKYIILCSYNPQWTLWCTHFVFAMQVWTCCPILETKNNISRDRKPLMLKCSFHRDDWMQNHRVNRRTQLDDGREAARELSSTSLILGTHANKITTHWVHMHSIKQTHVNSCKQELWYF